MKKSIVIFLILIICNFKAETQIIQRNNYQISLNSTNLVDFSPYSINRTSSRVPYGYIVAPTMLSMFIISEITRQELIPSLPLGIAASCLLIFSVPFISNGDKSVNYYSINNSTNLRIRNKALTSWILYYSSTGMALSLILIGAMQITPPAGLVSVTGILGTTSVLVMTSALHLALRSQYSTNQHSFLYKPNVNFGVSVSNYSAMINSRLYF